MDVWQRERRLARTTVGWGVVSVVAGLGVAVTRDGWRRSFGFQTAGWGAVDLGIAWVSERLQDRRMRRQPDPYASDALASEERKLRAVLVANTVADAGYVVLGVVLARDPRPRVAGSGAAIVVQGAFLVLHDGWHALDLLRGQDVSGVA